MRRFIWGGKTARCPRSNLITNKQAGWAGLIDICDYFWAVRLDQLKWWFNTGSEPLWVEMEKSLAPVKDLTAFLVGDIWKPWDSRDFSPSIRVSIQAYIATALPNLPQWNTNSLYNPYILKANIPMLSTKLFPHYGITTVHTFFLCTHTALPEHILDMHLPPKIWQFFSSPKPNTKGILLFYNLIQEKHIFREYATLTKWE